MLTAYVKQVISRTISLAHTDSQTLTKLLQPAARAQCVPASSTLVQCVFSQGGIILKPHFARLSYCSQNWFFLKETIILICSDE